MPSRAHPVAWDYLTRAELPAPDDLAALGDQGWELVAAIGDGTLIFKRPAPSFRDQVTLDQKRRYYALLGHPVSDDGGTVLAGGEA